MPRTSPFADVTDGPADDAVVVALGGPTRTALGCFGLTTLFLAAIALGAVGYAVFADAPRSLHIVAGVVGGLFLLIVLGLTGTVVRALRRGRGVAFDADGVWCRPERAVVRLPWPEIAVVRVVPPEVIKGIRTSTPRTPAVELSPVDETVVRRHTDLADSVTSGEPVRPQVPSLRYTFRLATAEDALAVAAAISRFAPEKWAE